MPNREEGKEFGVIYMLENQVNEKQYIGQTIDINRRMAEHRREEDLAVDKAIKKHSYENFDLIILEDEVPRSKLGMKERQYIADYNTFRGKGYNCGAGSGIFSEEIRQKMSEALSGKDHPQTQITEKEGKKIKGKYEENEKVTMKDLAEVFDTNHATISAIVRAEHWTTQGEEAENITGDERIAKSQRKLTKGERKEIRKRYKAEENTLQRDLAREYNITQSNVSQIVCRVSPCDQFEN